MLERLTVGPLGENAYILLDESTCILVDPGAEGERILSFLDSRGLVPTVVVATHGHLDHTAAIPELLLAWQARGRKVPLAVHELDRDYFGPTGEETNRRLFEAIGAGSYFDTYWRPIPSPDILLSDGDAIPGSDFRVIHSPGHTRGSMCLYDAGGSILVSGAPTDRTLIRRLLKRVWSAFSPCRPRRGFFRDTETRRQWAGSPD